MHGDCQIIRQNIEQIINETRMKRDKKFLVKMSDDMTDVYAILFCNDNHKKATEELNS